MSLDGMKRCVSGERVEWMADGWEMGFVIVDEVACLTSVVCMDGMGVEIEIPASVAWNGCRYNVESVHPNAFEGCGNLRRVTLPASVEVICDDAFVGCGALEEIWCKSTSVMMRRESIMDSVRVYRGEDRVLWVMNDLKTKSKNYQHLKITKPIHGRCMGEDYMIHDIVHSDIKNKQ